jgi:uncharacterized protein (DUF2225 family)
MTTFEVLTLTCPICDKENRTQTIASLGWTGMKRTDFRENPIMLPYLIHTCGSCGFTGIKTDFEAESEFRTVDKFMFRKFLTEIAGETAEGKHALADVRYELAAKIAIHEQRPKRTIGLLYLNAAWCAEEQQDYEAERFYRIKAAENLGQFISQPWISEDEMGGDGKAVLCYLTGETWRRAGYVARAKIWFSEVAGMVVDSQRESWVVELANQQMTAPREYIA